MQMHITLASIVVLASSAFAQGLCSGSLSLKGGGEHVRIANHKDLQPAAAATFEAWVLPRGRGRIISKGDGLGAASNRSFDMTVGRTGVFSAEFFLIGGGVRNYVALNAPTAAKLGVWHHVAATFDSKKREVALYVDGKQVAKKTTPAGNTIYQSTTPMFLGGTPPWNIWLDGDINQVRVWNIALTGSQVLAFSRVESASLLGVTAQWSLDGHLFDGKGAHDGTAIKTIAWRGGCATWTNYHAGTKGPFGIPAWRADKRPVLGTTVSLVTDNASKKAAAGVFVLGAKAVSAKALGGTLLAEPLFVFPAAIPANGAKFPLAIPKDNKLLGLPLFTQLIVFYPGTKPVAFSRGAQLMLGT